ncbi:MAG: hypothetical protein PQJ58_14895 [Spirochaetales bacterium]|nr:hypothetical protein [Spirochaetales bacterium]
MELRSVSGQVNIAQLANISKNSGRISLPVSRALTPYAQFEYVKGVPSSSSNGSVPLHRLRVLNTLINGLVSSQSDPFRAMDPDKMSDESVKALIDQYSSQLHSALNTPAPYGAAGGSYSSGALVNVLV